VNAKLLNNLRSACLQAAAPTVDPFLENLPDVSRADWLMLFERDPDYPLDSDGAACIAGPVWFVRPEAIEAVKVTPESSRGDRTEIFLRGRKTPVLVCESLNYIVRGPEECAMCGRDLEDEKGYPRHCAACESHIAEGEDGLYENLDEGDE
jgi:hypothetical protein